MGIKSLSSFNSIFHIQNSASDPIEFLVKFILITEQHVEFFELEK